MILVIDNYDSFAHNLARYVEQLGHAPTIYRNDAISTREIEQLAPRAILLSPGPCTPSESGICCDVVRQLGPKIPILGVCLGHQAIVAALGGNVVRAARPMHGRGSSIQHDQQGLFADLPTPMQVGRYHSLIAERATLPRELMVTATAEEETIMGVAHESWPTFGVQFHPESILTEHGYDLLANFLRIARLKASRRSPVAEASLPPCRNVWQQPATADGGVS